jgi:hypothetical protein
LLLLLLISNKFWMGEEGKVGSRWGRREGAELEGRIRGVEGENKWDGGVGMRGGGGRSRAI